MHILLDICLSPNTIVFVLSVFIISPYLIASLCSESRGWLFRCKSRAAALYTVMFQLPIPLLVASVTWRMKKRGWKQGHHELATTPSGSHQSLSSLHADNHHHHQQQQPCTGNEYGAVTPTRDRQYTMSFFYPTHVPGTTLRNYWALEN